MCPDPIFFLHHVQLDKLWWEWQQEVPSKRFTEYFGKAFNSSSQPDVPATLNDSLNFMGMWRDIKVSEVMRADKNLLCYRY
jgi:tyrosinase